MTPQQTICHLTDFYRCAIGERELAPARHWMPRPILKQLILYAPWSRNAPTPPEVDQNLGGTPPTDFERDRESLIEALGGFCDAPDSARGRHPLLGILSRQEWMRWGYLHADHHLRQFGA
jgi:hypothetical protein